MRSDLKAKFLQHLNCKKGNEGFTLIELLVVIIIIGILTAIALPSFLNQSNKAKLTEAKNNVRLSSEAQKAFFVEYGSFITATDAADAKALNAVSSDVVHWFEALGVSPNTQTDNYDYHLVVASASELTMTAAPTGTAHKGYYGGIQPLRGVVDQVYCTPVKSVAEGGPTIDNTTAANYSTATGTTCINTSDYDSSKKP